MQGERVYIVSESMVNTIRDAAKVMKRCGSENLKHYAEGVESVLEIIRREQND